MPNGVAWSPTFPLPKLMGVLGPTLYARSSTPSSMLCAAAVPGDCSRTTSLQQEDRLPLLPLLAFGWNMGKDARRPAPASAGSPQEKPSAQRSHRRQSVGQNDRGGRRAKRIRWRQEGQRPKTPLTARHAGFGAQSAGPQRRGTRPGGHQGLAGDQRVGSSPEAPLAPVDGRWLHRRRQGRRLGAEGIGMDGRDRTPSTEAGFG